MKPHPRGRAHEAAARRFLESRGLRILQSNFHCRFGEIDLIAEDGEDLVFVEVRARRNPDYGGPLASIGAGKRNRLRRSALAYLQRTAQSERPCRFDVIGFGAPGEPPDWIRNAFDGFE